MTAEIDHIPHFDITVSQDTLEEDMYRIYRQLFGDQASRDRVSVEELPCGYVNAIWKLSLKNDESKSLVFRTFGTHPPQEMKLLSGCLWAIELRSPNFNASFSSSKTIEGMKLNEKALVAKMANVSVKENSSKKKSDEPRLFSRLSGW